jgi:hypothetical protein
MHLILHRFEYLFRKPGRIVSGFPDKNFSDMNTLTSRTALTVLSLAICISCATVEEDAAEPVIQVTDMTVLEDLSNLAWRLVDCPAGSSVNIEGFSSCDYLGFISFTEESIFVRHGNNQYYTIHNICFVDGAQLKFSRQGCSFTNWSGVVDVEVVRYDENELELAVSFPNLNNDYNERYVYERS